MPTSVLEFMALFPDDVQKTALELRKRVLGVMQGRRRRPG